MSIIIGIKDFRKSLATIADEVMKGKTYTVMRRSKPAFTVKPYEIEEVDEKINEPGWTSLIDFTERGKKKGIDAKELLRIMENFEKKYGQNRKISK